MHIQTQKFFQKHDIRPENILYVIREDKKSSIYLLNGQVFTTYITMKDILSVLPEEDFLRVNKSYVLPVAQIASVIGSVYTMTDGRAFVGRVKDKGEHIRVAKTLADGTKGHPSSDRVLAPGVSVERQRVILIIEKGRALSDLLANDFIVLSAGNCAEAQALAEQIGHIAAILLDVQDADSDIIEGLRRVKEATHADHLPLIITSAYADHDDLPCPLVTQADEILYKPYHEETVSSRVRGIIHLYESAELLRRFEQDDLTGLYQRKAFERYAAMHAAQSPEKKFHILCSDFEDFKLANEWLGTQKCDQLLRQLAHMLSASLPGHVMGARLSGDVFAFLLENSNPQEMRETLEFVSEWEKPYGLSVRFGLAELDDPYAVSVCCDHAMLAIKTIEGVYGKVLAEFDEELKQTLLRNRLLINKAELALRTHQFEVYFQPKLNLKTMQIEGAEALVRWLHPDFGLISPRDFLPLFDQNGFISRLDEYLCDRVCKALVRWRTMGRALFPISINLSSRDFEHDDLVNSLFALIDSHHLPHELFHFEITDSGSAAPQKNITTATQRLIDAGFKIELDDFGTGYSSLISLSMMGLQVLKLDKSLIDQMHTDNGRKILASALSLAKTLGLHTIAEGVESKAQVTQLSQMGCDAIQGHYYCMPLSIPEFERFVWQ